MSSNRYAAGAEGEFEPGSDGRVLRNLLRITDPAEMDYEEHNQLVRATGQLFSTDLSNTRFTAEDICFLHANWLGGLYSWAGQYRSVNIMKGDFPFASAHLIPALMAEFERDILTKLTPCNPAKPLSEHARDLAVVHAELILIHPFREGNGRTSRLLALAMAVQAGYPTLDVAGLISEVARYIQAIHRAQARDYEPMTLLFEEILQRN